MLAAHLARRGIDCLLVDGSGRVGRGVAYSTREAAHLLNVRAEGMSAWAEEPSHFAARFEAAGGGRRGFAERHFYAAYLTAILDEAIATGRVKLVDAMATAAEPNETGWSITLDDGRTIEAEALALASGNQPPGRIAAFDQAGPRFIADPWSEAAQAAIREVAGSSGEILFVGTGLTMIDLALSLDAAEFTGSMTALSRRGLVPRAHADFASAPVGLAELPLGNLRGLARWLRRRGAEVGWRAAVDSLRPHSHAIWQSLHPVQQRCFLRHARAWWDVHRHRIAPDVAGVLARLIAEQRLEIAAGRLLAGRPDGDAIAVTYSRRGGAIVDRHFDYVFNCTGPLGAIDRTRDPLLRSLLDRGAARGDELGLGLAIDRRARIEGATRLWAVGPLTKALFWEIVAVPDIRVQVAAIADDIAKELGR